MTSVVPRRGSRALPPALAAALGWAALALAMAGAPGRPASAGAGVAAAEPGAAGAVAITAVTLIDATGAPARPDSTVVIEGDRIAAVGRSGAVAVPAGAMVVDGRGLWLVPGLADMHVHLANQPDRTLTRDWMLPLLLVHGVTLVRDMGGDWGRLSELRREIAAGTLQGPRIVAAGGFVDGPGFVDDPVRTPGEARRRVNERAAAGVDFVKVQANLSVRSWRAAVAEAERLGIPLAGHVPEAVSAFEAARRGQRSIEHSSPILPGDAALLLACSSRERSLRRELLALGRAAAAPDPDRDALRRRTRELQEALLGSRDERRCDRLAAELEQHQVWLVPTQIWGLRAAPIGRADGIDAEAASWLSRERRERLAERRTAAIAQTSDETLALRRRLAAATGELVAALHRAGARFLAGTDSWDGDVLPGPSLHRELELLVASGLTPMEALQAATRNPALYLGEQADRGTVEPGKIADLVLLEGDPLGDIANVARVHAVVVGGRLISAQERRRMVARLRALADGS